MEMSILPWVQLLQDLDMSYVRQVSVTVPSVRIPPQAYMLRSTVVDASKLKLALVELHVAKIVSKSECRLINWQIYSLLSSQTTCYACYVG